MAAPGDGHLGFFQFGKNANWGGNATITNKVDLLDESVELDPDSIVDEAMWGVVDTRATYQGSRFVKGGISVKCTYEGILELLRACFGNYSNTLIDTTRDHVFKSGAATLPALCGQVVKGNVPAGKCSEIDCFKVRGFKLEGSNQTGMAGLVKLSLSDIVGHDLDPNVTPTSISSFPALLPVKFDNWFVMDDGTADAAVDVRVRSWSVEVAQPHTDRERAYGSLLIDEPLRSGRPSYIWTFQQEFKTKTAIDMLRAGTIGSPRLLFQHPTTLTTVTLGAVCNNTTGQNTITRVSGSFITDGLKVGHYVPSGSFPVGTYVTAVAALTVTVSNVSLAGFTNAVQTFTTAREFEIRSNNAFLLGISNPMPGPGVMIATTRWRADYDTTDACALYARIRGTEAALA